MGLTFEIEESYEVQVLKAVSIMELVFGDTGIGKAAQDGWMDGWMISHRVRDAVGTKDVLCLRKANSYHVIL